MPLTTLFSKPDVRGAAEALYSAAVAQARQPGFYTALGVPDTVDGRFEMVALHVYLILRCLKQGPAPAPRVAQALFDTMFDDMDRSLREAGAGDLGVGRRVKDMAKAFYGRIAAYDDGIDGAGAVLLDALSRNLYRGAPPEPAKLEDMAAYARREMLALEAQGPPALTAGRVRFGTSPGAGGEGI